MEILTFDSGWRVVENDSETGQWVFARSDDGHVTAKVAGNDPNPTAFGNFFPQSEVAFAEIEAFLKPIEQMPHFQESWKKFCLISDFEDGAQYLIEERGPRQLFTAENVEIFAKLFIACFPITGHYNDMSQYLYDGFYGFSDDNIRYQPYLSALDYRELVIGVTGVWRKDIARELHEMTIGQLGIINEFSSLVTPENLVEAMSEARESNGHYDYFTGSFQSLEVLQPSVRVRLLKQLLNSMRGLSEDRYLEVEDTVNMVAIVGAHKQFRGCKSWQEVHDTAMKLAPAVNGDREITPPEVVENLSKVSIAGYSFEILTLPNEFVELGDSLKICIGKAGYYFKALRGDSYCFRVLKDDAVIGALEVNQAERVYQDNRIKEWRVAQLYGHGNSELHDKVSLNRFIVGNLNSSNFEKVLERV
jgi:hypothetical protein